MHHVRFAIFGLIFSLYAGQSLAEPRIFSTSFEAVTDFEAFYIVPQNHKGTASHDLSREVVRSGLFAHKGWVTAANPPNSWGRNNNHRGYPTIQLYKLPGGAFQTPANIEFWVWLDMELSKGQWFSFATLDHTTSNQWDPVLVNLSDEGFIHLMHVPTNQKSEWSFQTSTIKFPMKRWVKLSVTLHFDKNDGYAEVYQDGQLVSRAPVRRGNGMFTQAHFGLYAPPSVTNGVVFNDDLTIIEATPN